MKHGGMSPTKQHSAVAELVRRSGDRTPVRNPITGSNPVCATKIKKK